MKTIKEIADELGVSKQAVRNKIEKLGLQIKMQTIGNKMLVDEKNENIIKANFSTNTDDYYKSTTKTKSQIFEKQFANSNKKSQSKNENFYEKIFQTLQNQLAIKDKQLAEKDKQISDLTSALKHHAQSINAREQNQFADTIRTQMIENKTENHTEENRKERKYSFWSRLFERD